jgi:hypothetical protein
MCLYINKDLSQLKNPQNGAIGVNGVGVNNGGQGLVVDEEVGEEVDDRMN